METKKCSCCGLEKPLDAYHPVKKGSDKLRAKCKECLFMENKQWRKNNHGKYKKGATRYYEENKEHLLASRKEWATVNQERVKQVRAEYYQNNKETIKTRAAAWAQENRQRDYTNKRKYTVKNKPKYAGYAAKRRSVKLQATPTWLSSDHYKQMETEYQLAAWCSEVMGLPYEVDHIVPLQGKTVCGLHVPWNLRVIPEKDNRRKGNKIDQT
jgi:hypothetical protein